MTAVNNPFLSIVPRKGEKLIGVSDNTLKNMIADVAKGRKILLVSGDYGSGKSIVTDKIEKNLPENIKQEKWMFSVDLANHIRSLPMEKAIERSIVVFIDKFELSEVVDDKTLMKILELLVEMTKAGASFVISLTPKTIVRLFDINPALKGMSEIHSIKPLIFPEIKELVVSRLNEVRVKKSNDLAPFTEKELMEVWKKSKGNPRMILLILANFYDIKAKG